MSKRDYYEILGIQKTASDSEIKSAYRKLAIQFHPDKNPDDAESEAKFKEATEAYEILKDPQKRQRYDQFGHQGIRGGQDYHSYSNVEDIFSAFGDIFGGGGRGGGSIFDEFFGGGGARRSGRRAQGEAGGDIKIRLPLTLEEIHDGVEKKIKIKRKDTCSKCSGTGAKDGSGYITCRTCQGAGEVRQVSRSVFGQFINIQPCPTCHGQGKIIKESCDKCGGDGRNFVDDTITVQIPAGVEEGNYLPVSGKGHAGKRGGPSGDLIVILQEKQHEHFRRQGNDLIYQKTLSYPEAALGAEVEIPVINGNETVEVKAGTQPGTAIRLNGKGLPELNSSYKGDLIVVINIHVPTKLNPDEKRLLEELAIHENVNDGGKKSRKHEKDFFDKIKDIFS